MKFKIAKGGAIIHRNSPYLMKRLTSRMMHAPLAQPTTTSNSNPNATPRRPDRAHINRRRRCRL